LISYKSINSLILDREKLGRNTQKTCSDHNYDTGKYYFNPNSRHCTALQMKEYHSDEDDNIISTPPSIAMTPAPAFLQHMIDFDEEQEDDDSIAEQTIDEEYSGYVSGAPKRMAAVDPLKFWEVSTYNCHSICITDI
jgi:hypothetical protein